MDDVEKQLKWAIVSTSKENWDEDQEASHHLLAGIQRTCTWSKECDRSLTLKDESMDRERKQNHFANLCKQKTFDLRISEKKLILCKMIFCAVF